MNPNKRQKNGTPEPADGSDAGASASNGERYNPFEDWPHDDFPDLPDNMLAHDGSPPPKPLRALPGAGHTNEPYDRILRAARHQFATQGFDGTTVRDIATEAEVNLGAIGYYFENKAGLYARVLQLVLGPLARRILAQSNRQAAPLDQLEGVVREFFDHVRANPDMPALMVREMASGKTVAPTVIGTMRAAMPLVAAMIARGQQDGSIRAGDPILLTLSTMAQPVYLTLTRRAIAEVLQQDPDDAGRYAALVEHAVVTVRAALERRPT